MQGSCSKPEQALYGLATEIGTSGNLTSDLEMRKLQNPKSTTRPISNGLSHHCIDVVFCLKHSIGPHQHVFTQLLVSKVETCHHWDADVLCLCLISLTPCLLAKFHNLDRHDLEILMIKDKKKR